MIIVILLLVIIFILCPALFLTPLVLAFAIILSPWFWLLMGVGAMTAVATHLLKGAKR